MKLKNRDVALSTIIMSILVAFYIDVKCINWTVVYGFLSGSEGGLMSLLYPAVVAAIFFVYVFSNIKKNVTFSKESIFLSIYLIFFFFITSTLVGPPRVSVPFFALFTIIGLLLANFTQIDGRILIKAVMFLPCFGILRIDRIFFMALDWADVISMDASYAFLTPVLANIVYLFTFFKQEGKLSKYITVAISAVNFVYFMRLFQFGSRGPLLAIFSLIAFIWAFKYSCERFSVMLDGKRLITSIIVIVLILISINPLLDMMFSLMDSVGIQSRAIEKVIRLSAEGDISNGRSDLKTLAIDGFYNNIVFGNGLDRFDANTSEAYPHNFILQTLYDGGLLLFAILLIPMVRNIFRKFKNCSYDQYVVYTFLLFASVPYALFSQDMWENAILWVFIGVLYSKSFVKQKTLDNEV